MLSTVQNDIGELLAADPARQHEAQAAFETAPRELVALARAYPHIPGIRRDFAVACNGIGGAYLGIRRAEIEDDPPQAKNDLESASVYCQNARRLLVDLIKSRDLSDYESQPRAHLANSARVALAQGNRDSAPAPSMMRLPWRIERRFPSTQRARPITGYCRKWLRSKRASSDRLQQCDE